MEHAADAVPARSFDAPGDSAPRSRPPGGISGQTSAGAVHCINSTPTVFDSESLKDAWLDQAKPGNVMLLPTEEFQSTLAVDGALPAPQLVQIMAAAARALQAKGVRVPPLTIAEVVDATLEHLARLPGGLTDADQTALVCVDVGFFVAAPDTPSGSRPGAGVTGQTVGGAAALAEAGR